ncbi:cytochrome P450 family 1 protein [Microdochium nivale]|nr:cytochrome P450 family 1 protein [Microdochium nivale]
MFLMDDTLQDVHVFFSAGRDLCLGRMLASKILVCVVLMLMLGVDIETEDGAPLKMQEKGLLRLAHLLWRIPHSTKQKVRISRRDGWAEMNSHLCTPGIMWTDQQPQVKI